jgi:hypothetical protein
MSPDEQPPPAAEVQKMTAVAQAGAEAGAQAESPEQAAADAKTAMRRKADEVKLELSDEQIKMLADTFVKGTVEEFERRGAFDQPPEPVHAPDRPPPAPAPPGEQGNGQGDPSPAPQPRSWAARFMGR